MLYKKNNTEKLDMELFKSPTSEYRGTPFWAWNCKLEKDELLRQIECLKEMGFGGFHMHSRAGMGTEYLGKDFMELVSACAQKAEEENMIAWLYDEDRWPSGAAGGYVTKKIANRQKFITFTVQKCESVSKEEYIKTGIPCLIACFDIVLNDDGSLKSYEMIDEQSGAKGKKWYVYMKMAQESGWFNNQTYVDTMSKEAMQEFINITYDGYKNAVGDKFGTVIPSIFTDEPQISHKENKKFSSDLLDVSLPWTYDFDDTYKEAYGDDIIPHLPELIWEIPDGAPSLARYRYHDHICERFAQAFSDQCGAWCDKNGIYLTGHMMEEPTLRSQTHALSEAMRSYRGFGIPGIDMLCDSVELSTAKQAQSAVHQYGREGMLSELYGVTNWDFDFRGHKFQGDWQAALGVTIRVPHLSWVTMKGSAKRDYPASINYQSPWYKEYSYIENHFARLNTVLTRGKPIVKVGVIHPIESFWLSFGALDLTSSICDEMEDNFQAIISRLLFGMIDFDFISESLMPDLYNETGNTSLKIGKMSYDAVIIPNMRTMRRSTLDILRKFRKRGGKLIFVGDCPECVDARICGDVRELFDNSIKMSSASVALLNALEEERFVSVFNSDGKPANNLIYALREDGSEKYLFLAHGKKDNNRDVSQPQQIRIILNGVYEPQMLDTLTGAVKDISFEIHGENTIVYYTLYNNDSVLLRISSADKKNIAIQACEQKTSSAYVDFKTAVEFERDEYNVVVLDMAELSFDGKNYEPKEEILRIDRKIREELKFPLADGHDSQPWTIEEEKISNFAYLRFTFESEFEAECMLGYEEAESVILNGVNVSIEKAGWYTDKSIFTMALPKLKCGKNELIIKAPVGKRVSIENFFLLGDFDVILRGCDAVVKKPENKLAFGSIVNQGMPFYGGNIIYKTKINTPECDIKVRVSHYRGALIRVYIDGKDTGPLVFAPYEKKIKGLSAGEHTLELKLFGNRKNTFGALHNCDPCWTWHGPNAWYTDGDQWSYEYCLTDTGILTSPIIEIFEK